MASSEVAKYKMDNVLREIGREPAHAQKDHFVLRYSFGPKKDNSRIIRGEGDGKYYDYSTKKTYSSLQGLERALGIKRNFEPEKLGATHFFLEAAAKKRREENDSGGTGTLRREARPVWQTIENRTPAPTMPGIVLPGVEVTADPNAESALRRALRPRAASIAPEQLGQAVMPAVVVKADRLGGETTGFIDGLVRDSKSLFDYIAVMRAAEARAGKKGNIHCSDFAFFALTKISEKVGAGFSESVKSTWEIDAYLKNRGQFERESLSKYAGLSYWDYVALKHPSPVARQVGLARDFLEGRISAPPGTILTFRYANTHATTRSGKPVPEDMPTHTLVSLGNGLYIHNITDELPSLVDFMSPNGYRYTGKEKVLHSWVEGYEAFLQDFYPTENSHSYAPRFQDFSRAERANLTPASLGMKNSPKIEARLKRQEKRGIIVPDEGKRVVTPNQFASAIRDAYGMPYSTAITMILEQNGIPASRLNYLHSGLSVELPLPSEKLKRDTFVLSERSTPVKERLEKGKGKTVQQASFLPSGSSIASIATGKSADEMADLRAHNHYQQAIYMARLSPDLGVPKENIPSLSTILYLEQYSSPNPIDWRSLKKFIASKTVGSGMLHSFGAFQSNVDRVVENLDNPDILQDFKTGMASARSLTKILPVSSSTLAKSAWQSLRGLFGGEERESSIGGYLNLWGTLDASQKRVVASIMLSESTEASLYFASLFHSQNRTSIREAVKHSWGSNFTMDDIELTAFYSYNRGLPGAYAAIFQQNLLSAAEQNFVPVLQGESGFKIVGALGENTRGLFARVCEKYGIKEITVRFARQDDGAMIPLLIAKSGAKKYEEAGERVQTFSAKDFAAEEDLFSNIFRRYSNVASFFRQKEFSSIKTYPCLNYEYLAGKQQYLTEYSKAYYFFNPTEEMKRSRQPPTGQQNTFFASR